MRILCLYNNDIALELFKWLEDQGHEIVFYSGKLTVEWCRNQTFDMAVSYTYRYVLSADVIEALNQEVVNIHTSYLPFNRGADPNLWSILEGTPRGVTLHYVDEELDHGGIIAQTLMDDLTDEDTLKSTYERLDQMAKELFKTAFAYYDFWRGLAKHPVGEGSYHRSLDAAKIYDDIGASEGYAILITKLRKMYCEMDEE